MRAGTRSKMTECVYDLGTSTEWNRSSGSNENVIVRSRRSSMGVTLLWRNAKPSMFARLHDADLPETVKRICDFFM